MTEDNARPKTQERKNPMGSTAIRESKSQEAIGRGGPPGASRSNFAYRNRLGHVGDPQNFAELAYEKRVRDLQTNKVARSHLSSKVIETWINETLMDAGHLDIPGIILKPESKKPLTRYGIDRNQLSIGSIPS